MSQIQYKFRSTKEYSAAVFDGLSIAVADLKQEILREQKLNPEDFDLVITNEQTNEDYKDDSALIPKNTVVLVRRIPYTGPKMSRMMANNYRPQTPGFGGMPYGARGPATGPGSQYGYRGPQGVGMGMGAQKAAEAQNQDAMDTDTNDPEDASISAMLQQSNDQWMHQQSILEMQRPAPGRGGFRGRPNFMRPEHQHPPPPGYVCHRCGTQGHWIYNCPTMSQGLDGSKPGMHRVKRTTGIPKSFLQKVENLDDVGNALVTSDGTLVVATANEAAWKTAQRLSRNAISTDDDIDSSLVPDTLKCNTCAKLVRDAVAAPCCKTVFCSACIEGQLLDPGPMHFTCPKCRAGLVPDQLEVASETRGKVDEFLREYSSRHNAADESEKPANGTNGASSNIGKPPATTVTVVSAAPAPAAAIAVPAATTSPAATTAPAPAAQRPPTQVPPRPRPPMGMVPGMMMGGFPGLPMGQMPFMGGMVPPGMMGQWNGTAPSQDSQPSRGPDNTGRRGSTSEHELPPHESRSRNSSRARRDHSRVRSSSRADRDRSRDSHSRRRDYSRERSSSRYRESRRDSHRESRRGSHRDDDRRDSHREDDRRDSRRDESRRDSRRDEDRRESRRDDEHRDSRSRRRGDSAERRRHSGRSRSPASRSSHSRRRGGDSKPAELSIRGQSSIAAGESKPRSIAERLNDTRASDRSNGRSGGRRNRRR